MDKIHAAIDKAIDLKVSQNIDLMAFLDLGTKTSKSIFLFKVYHLQYHDYHYIRPPSAVFFFCKKKHKKTFKKHLTIYLYNCIIKIEKGEMQNG